MDQNKKRIIRKLLVRAGLYRLYTGRAERRGFPIKDYNRLLETGHMPTPQTVKFEPTVRCNLNCSMCHQKERRRVESGEISYEQVCRLVDGLSDSGVSEILLVGGEIFMRKDIYDIFSYIESKGLAFSMITNGTLIDEKAAKRLSTYTGLTAINYSLDGLKERHNRLRGSPNAFDSTLSAIQNTAKNNRFAVVIASVIVNDNIEDIPGIIELAKKHNVDAVTFTLEMFNTAGEVDASKKMLGMEGVEFFPEIKPGTERDYGLDKLRDVISLILRESKKSGIPMRISPEIANTDLEETYGGRFGPGKSLMCNALKKGIIDQKGDVFACPMMKKSFGNVLERPFSEIWNSQEFCDFRKSLLSKNLVPLCYRCCSVAKV